MLYCACRAATHHDHHHLTVNLYAFPFTVVGEDILLHLPTQLFRLLYLTGFYLYDFFRLIVIFYSIR